jgi:hypothetical protein
MVVVAARTISRNILSFPVSSRTPKTTLGQGEGDCDFRLLALGWFFQSTFFVPT